MGVYYDASIVWGLFIPRTEELYGQDLEDVYEFPVGFSYSMGGDLMSSINEAYVLHPSGASSTILDTAGYRETGFGVHRLSDIYTPTYDDWSALTSFAERYGLKPDIGWFAISSVG